MFGSGRLSPLVADGVAAATNALDAEVEVIGVPVDLDERAVAICIVGDQSSDPDTRATSGSATSDSDTSDSDTSDSATSGPDTSDSDTSDSDTSGPDTSDSDTSDSVITEPERLVIKATRNADEATRERTALTILAAHLPVPEIRFEDTNDTVSTTGLTFLDGDPVDHRLAPDRGWTAAASALRTVHGLDPGGLSPTPSHPDHVRDWADTLAAAALELGIIDADVAERFRVVIELREQSPPSTMLVHGDASSQHFLQRGGSLTGLLDLGDAGQGDAAADLAVLTLWAPERIESVVDAYCSAGQTDPATADDLLTRIAFHRPLRQLAAAIWNEQRGFSPTPFVVALYEELLKPAL